MLSSPTPPISVEPIGPSAVRVTARSGATGRINALELPVSAERVRGFYAGTDLLAQEAFPELDADQLEFLITGTLAEEWAAMFGGGE